jgi:hypothetical protein
VIIDGHGRSRNIAYAFHAYEDTQSHLWVLRHLFSVLPARVDRVYVSAITTIGGVFLHLCCLHHLVETLLRILPRSSVPDIKHSVPSFGQHITRFPLLRARNPGTHSLTNILFRVRTFNGSCGQCYVITKFTAGVRTSGRIKVENRVNKAFGDTKTPISIVIGRLLERTNEKTEMEKLHDRQVMSYVIVIVYHGLTLYYRNPVPGTTLK